MEGFASQAHLNVSPLDVLPDPEGEAPVVVDEIAEVVDEGGDAPRVQQVHVNFNQKEDYLHRGSTYSLGLPSPASEGPNQTDVRVLRQTAGGNEVSLLPLVQAEGRQCGWP